MKRVLNIRPTNDRLQFRVVAFLETLGFATDPSRTLPPRTPDALAAEFVMQNANVDLILLPFHLHRDLEDRVVDGFGVLHQLAPAFFARQIPIVMPVSTFSLASSFERRMEDLRERRSPAVDLLVPLPEDEIGAPGARFRIVKLTQRRRAPESGIVSTRSAPPLRSSGEGERR